MLEAIAIQGLREQREGTCRTAWAMPVLQMRRIERRLRALRSHLQEPESPSLESEIAVAPHPEALREP